MCFGDEEVCLITHFYQTYIINDKNIRTLLCQIEWYNIIQYYHYNVADITHYIIDKYVEYVDMAERPYIRNITQQLSIMEAEQDSLSYLFHYVQILNKELVNPIELVIIVKQVFYNIHWNYYIRSVD